MGLLEPWLSAPRSRPGGFARPLVTLSYAQSLDGSISLRRGQPLALSGPESLKLTHQLRAAHDAILVGIGTVLSDDPQLNVRLSDGKNPQVIVLDSRLRFPLAARALKSASKLRLFCASAADNKAQLALEKAGAFIERQAHNETDLIDLEKMLSRLHELGIKTLMVEGGGQVISSFLAEDLVDRVVVTVAPIFIGGYKAVEHSNGFFPRLQNMQTQLFGDDLVVWGDLAGAAA